MSKSLSQAPPQPHSKGNYYAWLVCLSAGLFFFYEFFQLNLFDVINQRLRQEFVINPTELGWMSSAFVWGNVLFLLPAGLMLDRYSARTVILSALSICILGVFGFGFSHTFISATFFHALTGVGNGFCFLSCVVLVSRWFPPRQQALVIGCIVTMAFLGGMSAHTPFAHLNAVFGWRYAVMWDGLLGLLIFAWIAAIVKDKPGSQHVPTQTHSLKRDVFQALHNRQNIYAGLYTACLNLSIMVMCALWGNSYLREVHLVSSLEASHIVNDIFIGSIIGCPFVGWMSDKLGRRKPIMLIGAIITLALTTPLVMPITFSGSILKMLFFSLGLCTSTQVLSYPLIAANNPSSITGTATAMASILIMGVGGVAQVLFGALLQYHGHHFSAHDAMADFRFAMWIFPISALIASLIVFFMQEGTHKKT